MKILIIAPDFYPTNGGYANAITNFVKELSGGEDDVVLFTPTSLNGEEELCLPNVVCVRYVMGKLLLASGVWEVLAYFKIRNILKKEKIDSILFETAEFGLLGYLVSRSFKKVLVRIHACTETEVAVWDKSLYVRYRSFFTRIFFKRVEWILSTNSYHIQFYKEYFLKNDIYKIARKKFFVIPNIVYKNETTVAKNELFNKYSNEIFDNQKIFFTLGRLNSVGLIQKGIEDLLYAVTLLKYEIGENNLGGVRIFVVGDGEHRNYIQNFANRMKISEYFIFLDKVSHTDILRFLKISDGTILLSRFEGLSMFALEALAQGSPLLFSKSGGLNDLIVDGSNGFLVESQNIEAIKNKLKVLISMQSKELDGMRQSSSSFYLENFSPAVIAKKFKIVLELVKNS